MTININNNDIKLFHNTYIKKNNRFFNVLSCHYHIQTDTVTETNLNIVTLFKYIHICFFK